MMSEYDIWEAEIRLAERALDEAKLRGDAPSLLSRREQEIKLQKRALDARRHG